MFFKEAIKQFKSKEVVMVCEHIFEWGFTPACADAQHFEPATFTRDDGTTGLCTWRVCCYKCKGKKDADLVEMYWENELLHVADFCKPHPSGQGNPSSLPSSSVH